MVETRKFSFNGKYGMLTYKGWHHDKIERFKKMFYKFKLCIEKGKKDEYKHTHILFCYEKQKHIRNCKHWDIDKIHPNFKKIISKEHWNNVLEYLDKEGNVKHNNLTGNEYKFLGDTADIIQSHKTWGGVINDKSIMETVMRYTNWAREVWNHRPRPCLTQNLRLRKWQKFLIDNLEKQTDRQIKWIYDPKGNRGKSVLAEYMIDHMDAFYCNCGSMKDIAHAYNDEEYVVFDLPRTTIDSDGKDWTPYRVMEQFKTGIFFSPKYNSCMKRFRKPKILVLANFEPKYDTMTEDRWDVMEFNKKGLLVVRSLNIKRATSPAGAMLKDLIKCCQISDSDSESSNGLEVVNSGSYDYG